MKCLSHKIEILISSQSILNTFLPNNKIEPSLLKYELIHRFITNQLTIHSSTNVNLIQDVYLAIQQSLKSFNF